MLRFGGIPLAAIHKKAPASFLPTDRKVNVDPSVKRNIHTKYHETFGLKATEESSEHRENIF